MRDPTVVKFPTRPVHKTPTPVSDSVARTPRPGWTSAIPDHQGEIQDLLIDLVESISDGFALYDSNDRMVLWNEKYASIISYARDLMTPGVPFETLLRKCAEQYFATRALSAEEKEAWIQEAFRFQRSKSTYERPTADGKCYLVSRRRSGSDRIAVVWTDITERKNAEVALQKSEKLYRDLFETSYQGIAVECDKRLTRVNSAFARIFGLSSKDEIRAVKDLELLVAPHDRKRICRLKKDQLAKSSGCTEYEFQAIRKDGKPIWVQATAVTIDGDGKPALQVTYADVTEKKEFQEELTSKKLEAIGVMAHGIAMEFQKVNSSIMSAVRRAKMESYAVGLGTVSELLSDVEQIGAEASELTQQLLFLHRGGSPVKERTRVEDLLNSSLLLLRQDTNVIPIRKPGARIKLDVGARLWPVYVDKGQMIGVFRSVIRNGLHAMPFGGTLRVNAENLRIDRKIRGVSLPPGRYVRVIVVDQGNGISKDMLERIFDPYFTPFQKPADLHLASGYAVMKHHGGTIRASSRTGKGTRMELILPAVFEQGRKVPTGAI